MNDRDTGTTLSRRRLLRTTGAGLTGLAATPALANAQEGNDSGNDTGDGSRRIQTRGLMPETDRVTRDDDYTGFFVQLTARLEELDAGTSINCTFMNWDSGETDIYEAQLVERSGTEYETIATQVYVPQDTDLTAGDLFIINSQSSCEGPYIGVQMENIRADSLDRGYAEVGSTQNEGGDGTAGGGASGAFGPGFGPLAALSGIVGGAYALARRNDGE